jgi:uncharacterized protein YxjI
MGIFALKKRIMVQEAVGATSLNESYLITDAVSGCGLAIVEEYTSVGQKLAKMFVDKTFLPVNLALKDSDGNKILEIYKPAAAFCGSKFTVRDSEGKILCVFKQAMSLVKPLIKVTDGEGKEIGTIRSNWRFKNFVFTGSNNEVIANINHLFMGLTKHLLTTADDYEIELETNDENMILISVLASICVDFLYHES